MRRISSLTLFCLGGSFLSAALVHCVGAEPAIPDLGDGGLDATTSTDARVPDSTLSGDSRGTRDTTAPRDARSDRGEGHEDQVAPEDGQEPKDVDEDGDSSCASGIGCTPSECQTGMTVCTSTGSMCSPTGILLNGTACDAGAVCDKGKCAPCATGADCADAGSCQLATIACSTGVPVCTPGGNAGNGSSCGTNLYCSDGVCGACMSGADCVPSSNPCHTGTASCGDAGIVCTDTGNKANDGTSCGTNKVCSGGVCMACTAGASCNLDGNPCQVGTSSCTTGTLECENVSTLDSGASCGQGMVCNAAGNCIGCASGASCDGGNNMCLVGTTSCTLGTSQCTNVMPASPGNSCGAGMVCNAAGSCVACASGSCDGGNNMCLVGTLSCTSGMSQCTNVTPANPGNSCGTGMVCNAAGSCISCVETMACTAAGNTCQAGTLSCTSGTPECTNLSPVTNGMSCTGGNCCGGTCTDTTNDNAACGTSCKVCPAGSTCTNSVCNVTVGFSTEFSPCGSSVGSLAANELYAQQISLSSSITLTAFGQFGNAPTSGVQSIMALYNAGTSGPTTPVAYSGSVTILAGNNELPVSPSVAVSAGTYWIVGEYSAIASICTDNGSSNLVDLVSVSLYGSLPNPFGTPTKLQNTVDLNYYLIGTE
jgi:hypothetical protein